MDSLHSRSTPHQLELIGQQRDVEKAELSFPYRPTRPPRLKTDVRPWIYSFWCCNCWLCDKRWKRNTWTLSFAGALAYGSVIGGFFPTVVGILSGGGSSATGNVFSTCCSCDTDIETRLVEQEHESVHIQQEIDYLNEQNELLKSNLQIVKEERRHLEDSMQSKMIELNQKLEEQRLLIIELAAKVNKVSTEKLPQKQSV